MTLVITRVIYLNHGRGSAALLRCAAPTGAVELQRALLAAQRGKLPHARAKLEHVTASQRSIWELRSPKARVIFPLGAPFAHRSSPEFSSSTVR